MKPEENAAGLIVERLNLEPPVDVQALLKAAADVHVLDWDYDVDGLVVGLTSARPRVFVRRNADRRRQRFTMAHELGHIVLGWHTGAIPCHTSRVPRWLTQGHEAEASRFASAILVPDRFLSRIRSTADVGGWLTDLAKADVSAFAGAMALVRGLPPGYMFVVEMPYGPEVVSSDGTSIRLGWIDGQPDYRTLERSSTDHAIVGHQNRRVRWYRFVEDELLPEVDADPRSTAKLLQHAADRCRTTPAVVNGVIGYAANMVAGADEGTLFQTMLFRIKLRGDLQALLDDPDFRVFLARRARELAARRLGNG